MHIHQPLTVLLAIALWLLAVLFIPFVHADDALPASATPPAAVDLFDARKKEIALELVATAENSTLDWRAEYGYVEDIGDGRGYTAGIIGFCSGTGDMLEVVRYYTKLAPNNVLTKYLPALEAVNNSPSHAGLDPTFVDDWKTAARDTRFQKAQTWKRDTGYFTPAVQQAKADGLRALGQFIYFDAMVVHGPGDSADSFGGIRKAAMAQAKTPAQGGDEISYLHAYLDARRATMRRESAHWDVSRVDTAQRVFLLGGNLDLTLPLAWKMYGQDFHIDR